MIPAAVVYFFVYVARRIRRWHYCGAARNWPSADAKIISSFQMDENQVAFSTNAWDDEDLNYEDANDYSARWAVAIQYSYQVEDEYFAGTFFLPETYSDGDLAQDAANAWTEKTITVRYNPSRPKQSFFLEQDGAPGKPHIPRLLDWKPYITELSLK
jgi:uncharacterized protein DUF3592